MLRFEKSLVLLSLVLFPVIIGCNDPKSASKENFKKAIQVYHDAHPLIISQVWLNLPVIEGSAVFKRNEEYLRFFASVGYLEGRDTVAEFDSIGESEDLFVPHNITVKRATKIWQLTEEGRKNYLTQPNPMIGKVSGFKWAEVQVKDVESFTEPADMMGKRVSEATYSITLVNEKPWASQIKNKQAFKSSFMFLNQIDAKRKSTLVLTSDGWIDARQ